MHRLVWAFAGRTYHIVGNLMPRLICPECRKRVNKILTDLDVATSDSDMPVGAVGVGVVPSCGFRLHENLEE